MENTEKKPRKFLKMLGKVGEIVVQEALLKILRGVISRIGGKKTLPSILFLILSICLYGQYPATGNKQRLGYQTTGDGLVWRGRASDTVALKSSTINNSYVILDTINNVILVYIKTKGGWKFNNADTIIINNNTDTTSLSSRINLKLNISDTASMLLKYLRKADTSLLNLNTRFAAKLNLLDTASMLTNYLRTGVAASTYVSGSGTTNYIPKFTATSSLGTSGLFRDANRFSINEGTDQSFGWDFMLNTSNPFIGNNIKASTSYERVERMASTTLFNPAAIIFGFQRTNNSSGSTSYGGINFMTTSGNLAGDINPIDFSRIFIEPDGNIGIGTMQPSYKFDIRGTLGVTGAATLSSTLAVTGNITEGGNNVLTNLDTTSLSSRVDGKVSLNGDETINGSKSFQNQVNVLNRMTLSGSVSGLNKILGKNTDGNGVGDITVGTGLSLTSNTLNATVLDTASMLSPYWRSGRFSGTLPIANGGTGATSESNARTNLKVDYLFIATNAGANVAVTTNRVFIVNSGGSSTTTLDLTTLTSGNTYMIKNLASGTIISSASNVIALNGGSASTPILSAGNVTPQWCTLVCDGTNWHIIQRN